jgi:hypothetical protein
LILCYAANFSRQVDKEITLMQARAQIQFFTEPFMNTNKDRETTTVRVSHKDNFAVILKRLLI